MSAPSESEAFQSEFERRAYPLRLRDEVAEDRDFLVDLFITCSPLAGFLPPPMLLQQADAKEKGHRASHPYAMRKIVEQGERPVGRVAIAWNAGSGAYCVDIALMPDMRGRGTGRMLLEAWIDVAACAGRAATLDVLRDNPALQLYVKLGLLPAGEDDGGPAIALCRPLPQI